MRNEDIMKVSVGKWPGILVAKGVPELAVSGKHGPCPMCGGKDRFRMIDREGTGRWICNQCGGGDGMDLFMAFSNQNFKQAANELRPMINGVQCLPPKTIDKEKRKRIMKQNVELWGEGTADHPILHQYLESRGLSLDEFRGADLRVAEKVPYFDEDGKKKAVLPAMLARVSTRDGKLALIHRTYLHEKDGRYTNKKKMTPSARDWKGGCVRLFGTKGSAQLLVAEGIETALSLRARVYRQSGKLIPCWAACSANAMENMMIPDHVHAVLIGADNDESFTGQKAAYTLANRLTVNKRFNKNVRVVVPDTVNSDWNDQLQKDFTPLEKNNG